jgi:hypothetical protein
MGAGVALVVSLLIAIAAVASGEVNKAAMRDSTLASQRSAAAYCVETWGGAALNKCLKQAWRDASGDTVQVAVMGNVPSRAAAAEASAFGRNANVTGTSAQGLMQASFGTLR